MITPNSRGFLMRTTGIVLLLALSNIGFAADWTWVSKTDEAKSCGTGISLETMGRQLQRAKVSVKEKKKISDGKAHIQMCGAAKGDSNAFLIPKKDLSKAERLGFKTLPIASKAEQK